MAPQVKKKNGDVSGDKRSTKDEPGTICVVKSTQAQMSATSLDDDSEEATTTAKSSTMSTAASHSVERSREPASRGLLPVTHKKSAGTSYVQPALSPGHLVLEWPKHDKLHKIQMFSSQKAPQPFLNK